MFDIGLDLTNSRFAKDRNEIIAKAFAVGVDGLIITSVNLYKSALAQQLAQYYMNCWSTAGIHPHESNKWTTESIDALYTLAQNSQVVAIGECGLDFDRNFSTPKVQEKVFIAQLMLAAELDMPVFLHCRGAHERLLMLLDPWLDKLPGAVLHCFTGSYQDSLSYLKRGIYLGITGWVCDERRGLKLREILPTIPANYLLLGTDAPYLLPRDIVPKPRSNRNEPAYLIHIFQRVALWRGETLEELEEQTDMNVRRLFGIIP